MNYELPGGLFVDTPASRDGNPLPSSVPARSTLVTTRVNSHESVAVLYRWRSKCQHNWFAAKSGTVQVAKPRPSSVTAYVSGAGTLTTERSSIEWPVSLIGAPLRVVIKDAAPGTLPAILHFPPMTADTTARLYYTSI